MTHPELLFLLHNALHIQKLTKKAKEEGEEFHPANIFTNLKNGIACQAQINEENIPILRVRNNKKSKKVVLESAKSFFGGEFIEIPSKIDGEFIFSAKELPKSAGVFK